MCLFTLHGVHSIAALDLITTNSVCVHSRTAHWILFVEKGYLGSIVDIHPFSYTNYSIIFASENTNLISWTVFG